MKVRRRGGVWLLIGIFAYVGGLLANIPLVLRGTEIPWGLIVIGLGVVLLIWDYVQARREAKRGDPPTPPP